MRERESERAREQESKRARAQDSKRVREQENERTREREKRKERQRVSGGASTIHSEQLNWLLRVSQCAFSVGMLVGTWVC